jgi:hypothetical protein
MHRLSCTEILALVALGALLSTGATAQSIPENVHSTLGSNVAQSPRTVMVPERVAVLLRPVLDALQRSREEGQSDQTRNELFYALTKERGHFADEALVVLMCFDVMGESQEDTDAVIARGRKMLPYITKYRNRDPKIPQRAYPTSMMKNTFRKGDDFQGAIKAIKHGWRGTWDNPEG